MVFLAPSDVHAEDFGGRGHEDDGRFEASHGAELKGDRGIPEGSRGRRFDLRGEQAMFAVSLLSFEFSCYG